MNEKTGDDDDDAFVLSKCYIAYVFLVRVCHLNDLHLCFYTIFRTYKQSYGIASP